MACLSPVLKSACYVLCLCTVRSVGADLHALETSREPLLKRCHHLFVGHHLGVGPHIAIKGHVLNEAHIDGPIPGQLHKVGNLIVIHSSHDNHIHLHPTPCPASDHPAPPLHGHRIGLCLAPCDSCLWFTKWEVLTLAVGPT